MKRSTFLRSLGATSAITLTGCSTTAPPPATAGAWPGRSFKTVRAFVYDCEAGHGMSFFRKDGTMHKGVLNAPGTLLSPGQVEQLIAAVNRPTPIDRRKPCYVPHHAFVFYNESDKPVANLEVCFTCRRSIATPEGIPDHFDYVALWNLLHELKVPAERGPYFYRQLYRQHRAKREG